MTVWLCSGQGAQKQGMGTDFLNAKNPEVTHAFDEMSDVLGVDLVNLALNGTEAEINDPIASQALTMAVSVGVGSALKAHGIAPDAIIGFSLGQISALVLADILTLHDAAELLKVRAGAMAELCTSFPGGMAALIGATLEDAETLCKETLETLGSNSAGSDEDAEEDSKGQGKNLDGGNSAENTGDKEVLVVANHNSPGQIVISGTNTALDRAQEIWKAKGKRSARLATAGAFHSPVMKPAADKVGEFCHTLTFNDPSVTLICNTDAKPFVASEAPERLALQVQTGVLFDESVSSLIEQGETDFVEIGYGGVLAGLVKRIDRSASRTTIGTQNELTEYIGDHDGR